MKEIENDIIKKYSYKDYVVYIKNYKNCYECYLQKECYGVIDLMFGVSKRDCTIQEFIEIVLKNVDNYIKLYKNEYED